MPRKTMFHYQVNLRHNMEFYIHDLSNLQSFYSNFLCAFSSKQSSLSNISSSFFIKQHLPSDSKLLSTSTMSIAPSGDRPSKKRTFDDSIEALIDGFPSKRRKILQDVTPYLTAQHQRPQINDQTAAPNVDHNRSISRPELSRKRPRSAEEEDDYSPTNRREGHHKKAKHDHAPSVPPIPQPNTQNHACAGDSVPDLSHHDREHEGRPDADREHSTDNRTTAQESHTNREGSERDLSDHQNQPETSLEESRSNRPQASGETSLIEPLGHGRVPPLVIPCEAGIHGDEPNDDAGIDNVEVEQATRCILQALYDAVAWFCRECGINANARATLCDNRTERQNYFYGKCLGEKPIEAASQCDLLVSMLGGCIEELIFRDKVFVSEVEGDVHLKRELEALKEHMGAQNSGMILYEPHQCCRRLRKASVALGWSLQGIFETKILT